MELQFAEREAVWAQSWEHSWWPAKIIKVQQQLEKTLYSVVFFAESALQPVPQDLTGDLLRPLTPDRLLPDSSLPLPLNALRSARRHAARTNNHRQRLSSVGLEQIAGDCGLEQKTEEMRLQNLAVVEEGQRAEAETPLVEGSFDLSGKLVGEITAENVLEMIAANRRREKPTGYSYQTRKEETQLQAELKRNLLLRFNLHAFDAPTPTSLPTHLPSRSIIQITQENLGSRDYRRMCRVKSRGALLQGETEMLRRRCVRKVTALLRREGSLGEEQGCKGEAARIVKRIVLLAEDSRIKLQSLFVTLVKALAATSSKVPCEERLSEFSNYLEQLETDKQEDEGSKITQIEVGN